MNFENGEDPFQRWLASGVNGSIPGAERDGGWQQETMLMVELMGCTDHYMFIHSLVSIPWIGERA